MSKIYFGTRDYMQWVKAPLVNTPLSNVGWANSGTDLNGGGFAKISPTAHKEYELSWGASPAQDIYEILDYRTGAYGEGYLYYVDPFAMRTNVLPGSFSMPRQLCNAGLMGGSHSDPTGGRVVATNLALNPSFEASSGTVEVFRNLATNPSFETASGTVEVARNLVRDPRFTSIGPLSTDVWAITRLENVSVVDGVFSGTVSALGDMPRINAVGLRSPVDVGTTITLSAVKTADNVVGHIARIYFFNASGVAMGQAISGTPVTAKGEHFKVSSVVPADAVTVALYLGVSTNTPAGSVVGFKEPTLYAGTDPGIYFDYSFSPNPDLTPSAVGTPGGSPSILTGTRAAGTGVGWQSKQWAATGEFSHYIPQGSVQEYVIGDGESFQIQPRTAGQTYLLNGDPHVTTEDPIQVSGPAMIEVGAGWWDNLTIVEGTYTGGYFDGDTSPFPDLIPSWTGAANASASVLTGKLLTSVPQATLADSVAYQSTDGPAHGASFQRVMAKSTSAFSIPVTSALPVSGSSYTLLMKARASRSGTEVIPRIRGTLLTPVTLTNNWKVIRVTGVAGTGSSIQTGFQVNSGSAQMGDFFDVDSVVLVLGNYTGDYFDGSSLSSNGFTFSWTSTPNASTSTKSAPINSPNYTGFVQPKPVVVSGADSRTTYVPVPPGYKLWLAYTATASLLRANGSAVPPTTPTATSPNWFTSASPVELKWSGTGTVWGAWGLILKDGETPTPDARWVPGKGASGMRFQGEPQVTGLSAVYGDEGGLLNASATLIETELWSN